MNTPFEPLPNGSTRIVYVKPIAVADLPEEVQAEIGAAQDGVTEVVYSVNAPDGQRLALVADRMMAFHLARAHDFAPVNVH
jgi:hypothetical protein